MSVKPYVKPRPLAPVGVLQIGGRMTDEAGTRYRFGSWPKGLKVYSNRTMGAAEAIRGRGELITWNGNPTRWERDGSSAYVLSLDEDPDDLLAGVVAWRDWAHGFGASVGSVGQTSMSVLKATLQAPLLYAAGDVPPLGEVIGGRIQAGVPPGHYGAFELWDLSAAYARTMAELPYGGRWFHVKQRHVDFHRLSGLSTWESTGWPCFIRAEVRVPALAWGPLPRRRPHPPKAQADRSHLAPPRAYPTGDPGRRRVMTGIWSLNEIRAAERAGCGIKMLQVWLCPPRGESRERTMDREHDRQDRAGPGGSSDARPFEPWWHAIQQGRSLPGLAGRLAKSTGNALWGQFIAYGTRHRISWQGGERRAREEPIRGRPPGKDLAELVTSTVRARLYTELIAPNGGNDADRAIHGGPGGRKSEGVRAWPGSDQAGLGEGASRADQARVFSVHTDGGILAPGARPHGDGWRRKVIGSELVYLGPQVYAYREAVESPGDVPIKDGEHATRASRDNAANQAEDVGKLGPPQGAIGPANRRATQAQAAAGPGTEGHPPLPSTDWTYVVSGFPPDLAERAFHDLARLTFHRPPLPDSRHGRKAPRLLEAFGG